jgi:AcrR family transcriptional regulator
MCRLSPGPALVKNERSFYCCDVPRVSDEHLAARRQQILDAARVRFTRNGFHATSMQDVIAEAGLSVGAVYRYFKSKDELVTAIAGQVVDEVTAEIGDVAEHEPPLPLDQAMRRLVDGLAPRLGPDGAFRLALQVWAESMRNPTLAAFVRDVYGTVRARMTALVRRAQEAGHLPPEADADAVGSALFGMLLGYLLQQTLTGSPDRDTFLNGVRGLLART